MSVPAGAATAPESATGVGFDLREHDIEKELRRHPFCRGMDDSHVATLTHFSRYWNLEAGEFLWRQGEKADTCFLVISGKVSLELGVPNEGANRLEVLKGGDVLGWSWLLEGGRWHFDARALTPVRGIALDTAKMRAFCAGDSQFGYAVLSRCTPLIAERLERTGKLALELLRTAHS